MWFKGSSNETTVFSGSPFFDTKGQWWSLWYSKEKQKDTNRWGPIPILTQAFLGVRWIPPESVSHVQMTQKLTQESGQSPMFVFATDWSSRKLKVQPTKTCEVFVALEQRLLLQEGMGMCPNRSPNGGSPFVFFPNS